MSDAPHVPTAEDFARADEAQRERAMADQRIAFLETQHSKITGGLKLDGGLPEGWTQCHWHGMGRCVDGRTGQPAVVGTCEFCFRALQKAKLERPELFIEQPGPEGPNPVEPVDRDGQGKVARLDASVILDARGRVARVARPDGVDADTVRRDEDPAGTDRGADGEAGLEAWIESLAADGQDGRCGEVPGA